MDPNTCYATFEACRAKNDRHGMRTFGGDLLRWVERGGFLPTAWTGTRIELCRMLQQRVWLAKRY